MMYALTFTENEIKTINKGLLELPAKESLSVINSIGRQIENAHKKSAEVTRAKAIKE